MSSNNLTSTTIDKYQDALDNLSSYLNDRQSVDTPASETTPPDSDESQSRSLKNLFLNVLFSRDDVFDEIKPEVNQNNYANSQQQSSMTKLAQLDTKLYSLGRRVFRFEWIDLPVFRQISAVDGERWWWKLDLIHYDDSNRNDISWRLIIQFIISVTLLVVLIPITISMVTQLAQVLLRIFIRVDAEQLGLDIITFIAIGIQILISGRITLGLASPFTNSINRFILHKTPKLLRWVLRFFPLSKVLVGSIIFAIIIVGTGFIMNQFSEQIFSTVRNVEQPLASRQSVIESASLLQADSDFGVELALIGVNLEQIGNISAARLAYQQALETKPTLVYAAYRLADTYIKTRNRELSPEDENLAFDLLDSVTQHIQAYRSGQITLKQLTLSTDDQVLLMDFLTLTSRAELFLKTHRPELARDTVERALNIVRQNPHLFVINDSLQNSLLNVLHLPINASDNQRNRDDQPPPDAIQNRTNQPPPTSEQDRTKQRLVRILYVAAQTYQTLSETPDQDNQEYADRAMRYWLEFISHADDRIVQEQIWLAEARKRVEPPPIREEFILPRFDTEDTNDVNDINETDDTDDIDDDDDDNDTE